MGRTADAELTQSPSKTQRRAEYTRRLDERRATLARLSGRERVIIESRLVVFLVGALVAWLVWGAKWFAPAWLLVPVGLFVILLIAHARATRDSRKAARAVEFYERGLARIDDRWSGRGEPGLRFLDPDHPFAADLDLFGVGSLFERLCTARTGAGEETLARWLLHPASVDEIRERQAAIVELRERLDLREDLEMLGSDVRAGIDPQGLATWGAAPRAFHGRVIPLVAGVLSTIAFVTLVGWATQENGRFYALAALVALLLEAALAWAVAGRVRAVLLSLERRTHELIVLSDLLGRVEREPFESPRLKRIREALDEDGEPASTRIARLAGLLQLLDAQKNQLFLPIALVLLWAIQLAVAIDAWRGRSGPHIARWLAAVGEFEALCALASYAWENPDDPFPTLVSEGAQFEAEGLGHPLIPDSACVRNDLGLGEGVRVLVVSGSNMSGKSTLLRTVGINAVLALAGAPVKAHSLRISPVSLGATLRVQDSLQAGRSRFFAEIVRLRQLVDLAKGTRPLLFLLDEILHGTNSHDRRIGAESVVRGLIELGAIGLVTTHDLALADIVDQLGPRAANVHFEDQFEDGSLQFDYRMRPGVVRKSNALALMRAVGFDV